MIVFFSIKFTSVFSSVTREFVIGAVVSVVASFRVHVCFGVVQLA